MLRTLKKKLAVNSSRKYIDAHMASAARSVPPGSLVLDAGASASLLSLAVRPSAFLLSLLYARLDLRHKHTASGFCKNYFAVAEKPQGGSG